MTQKSLYQKTVLASGIRVVTEKIPYVRSVSIGLWVTAGTCDENEENNGIAHFVEHMVFKGTESRSSLDIAESLESLGGHLNAFTSKEITCYYAHILDEDIDIAIDILADLVLHPQLTTEDIKKEKQVVLEEIKELDDTPDELVNEYFIELLYQPHPLSFSTLGKRETVNSLSRKNITDFIKQNYSGDRIIVAAAGNLEHAKIIELVNKYFQSLPVAQKRRQQILPPEKPQYKVMENNIQQAHLCLGRRSISYVDARRYCLLVLNTILGYGMSSRLFQNIREKHGLAYSIYSYTDFLKDTGIFGVYLGTDKDKLEMAIDLVKKELKAMTLEPVSPEELQKRKSQLKGGLLLGLESTSNRMNRLAKAEIYYDEFFPIDQIISSIDQVTQEQISEMASSLFIDEQMSTMILKPK